MRSLLGFLMRMKPFLYLTAVAVALLTTACGKSEPAAAKIPPMLAKSALPFLTKAPEWKLKDLDGREVTSEEFKGKVVLIDFWATWCPPCVKEIPEYTALQKKYADQGLVILGFSLDELPPARVREFGERSKLGYQVLMGDEETVMAFGGIEGLPTAFLIDRDGYIRHRKVGLTDMKGYERLIVSLL